jgi:hypothetical protein
MGRDVGQQAAAGAIEQCAAERAMRSAIQMMDAHAGSAALSM